LKCQLQKKLWLSRQHTITEQTFYRKLILEEGSSFKYLDYTLFLLRADENSNYNKSIKIINHELKTTEVQKHAKMKAYRIVAELMFGYGSEAWTIRKQEERRFASEEIKCFEKQKTIVM
jgi:hypothetical protein